MIKNNFIKLISITLISLSIAGCGHSVPRNELQNLPALIEIISLNLSQSELKLRVSHRNNLTRKANMLNCQLSIKDIKPIQFNDISIPDLTNYAVETINIDVPALATINTDNTMTELPYVLDCYLFSDNFREEQVIKKASLFKVPGSLSEYR